MNIGCYYLSCHALFETAAEPAIYRAMMSLFLIQSTCLLLLIHIVSPVVGESCIEAQSQLSEGAGQICNEILTSGTIYNLDNNTINTFCEKNDCPKILTTIYGSITKACGGGVSSNNK